ncbi:sigma-70 family RNA polymerase sigma factor [bacterium]|nr:sigma-70 family RNA polymerase sigma factor [bacterium]
MSSENVHPVTHVTAEVPIADYIDHNREARVTVRAEGLVKKYGGRKVVDGVHIDVTQGEIVGLLGPNGAGKTTTFHMITGMIKPNAGKIFFDKTNIKHYAMYRRARLGIGYLSQEASIFRKLTVEQNIMAILQTLKLSKQERQVLSRQDDMELIQRAVSGEQSAFKMLEKKYRGAITSLIRRMMHSHPNDVDDLVQETFIKAFQALANFNNEYAFSTWLYKIASNHCIDFLRKKRLKAFSIDQPIETKEGTVEYEIYDNSTAPDLERAFYAIFNRFNA